MKITQSCIWLQRAFHNKIFDMITDMVIYVLGANGIGMQGLISLASLSDNYKIYAYDDDPEYKKYENVIYQNFVPEKCDLIVYSSAVKENHRLRQNNIPQINRTDFLIKYIKLNDKKILVAGAHGKTTTASMLAYILGLQSYLVGGIIVRQKYPANHIKSEYTVIETDESDGSFLKWEPGVGGYKILTSHGDDHLDFFKTQEVCDEYFKNFILKDLQRSKIIIHIKSFEYYNLTKLPEISPEMLSNIITYGACGEGADYSYKDVEYLKDGIRFTINGLNMNDQKIQIPLLGIHNVENYLAIFALLNNIKNTANDAIIKNDIMNFPGIEKRMQVIKSRKFKTWNLKTLYSDYGHHPKEIEAVIDAFVASKLAKPTIVIEPHKFSRLKETWHLWPQALKNAKKVFVYPIYKAVDSAADYTEITRNTFVNYLKSSKIDAEPLDDIDKLDELATTVNDAICFSAGALSKRLSQYAEYNDEK